MEKTEIFQIQNIGNRVASQFFRMLKTGIGERNLDGQKFGLNRNSENPIASKKCTLFKASKIRSINVYCSGFHFE